MAQYIDKDAVLAEIEKLKGKVSDSSSYCNGWQQALRMLELSLDSLEVKGVDLDDEYNDFVEEDPVYNKLVNDIVGKAIAKHFFEIGLRTSNPLTWKDIDLILDITDQIANDDSMEEKLNNMSQEKYCTEVLKRFKAQKGE